MSEATLFRLAGWSAYFNAAVFLLSLVALMLFFSIGGFWGTINDSLSIIWVLSYIPLAVAFYQINRSVNAPISLASSIIGIAAMIVFAVLQFLLVLGLVRFEQTFTAGPHYDWLNRSVRVDPRPLGSGRSYPATGINLGNDHIRHRLHDWRSGVPDRR